MESSYALLFETSKCQEVFTCKAARESTVDKNAPYIWLFNCLKEGNLPRFDKSIKVYIHYCFPTYFYTFTSGLKKRVLPMVYAFVKSQRRVSNLI